MSRSSAETMKMKLLADFNAVMTEAEQLLRVVTDEGGDKGNALRAKMEHNLNAAKHKLRSLENAVVQKTRATAQVTDEYVRENPWQTMAIAAGLSAAISAVIGILLSRRE